jgi:hypothetical protein
VDPHSGRDRRALVAVSLSSSSREPRVAAYVYTGWHPIPERDAAFEAAGFGPGFVEWSLVASCTPRFEGHAQPRVPLLGPYDDRDPVEVGRRLALARAHGVDAFVYGYFWCRGKRVFEAALDQGYLGSDEGRRAPFALMWANRMPRRVLPVRRADAPVIEADRLVPSDLDDVRAMTAMLADHYLGRPNYLRLDGRAYLSIFDATFFVLELGIDGARAALAAAREVVRARGLGELHLAAIEPSDALLGEVRAIGFDSTTHYVHLPVWRGGPYLQDYATEAARRAEAWPSIAARTGLPYMPSIATGWDATPRGADFGPRRPDKYPWHPVVVGDSPAAFEVALRRGLSHARAQGAPLVFVASLNEWSEGHHLEPDARYGLGWLEAVRRAKG